MHEFNQQDFATRLRNRSVEIDKQIKSEHIRVINQ